jgi:hypothetical protein
MYSRRIAAVLAAFSFLSSPALAQKWGAHVDVEAKPGSKRNIGEADFFLPLMQDSSSLLFGNARLRVADHDNHEGNLGVGYRKMLDGWNLGGYGYFDRRKTSTGNKFNQVTLGAEALGRDWDFRANLYVPQGDKVRDLGTSSTATASGGSILVSTSTLQEMALKGYDVEAGWRAPVWAAEADKQLRLYAGGYHFSDNGVRVSGPRVRAELAMYEVPALWKGAQLMLGAEYQDDNARGGQGFVSVRLRIPLGSEKDSGRRMNFQERRMAAPVVRDVDVVTRSVVSAPVVEAATALADGRAFSVLSSDSTTGAALPGAVAAAGANSVVILSGTFNTTAATVMQTGQTLAGSATVRTASGRTATTPLATINGGFSGFAVEAANNSTLTGLTIRNTGSAGTGTGGVRVNGVTGVVISNNTIVASELGVNSSNGITLVGVNSATITGNDIRAISNNNGAVATAINVFSATSTVTIANNTLSGSGSTNPGFNRFLGIGAGATINTAASTGNTAAAGNCLNLGAVGFASFTNGTTCP